jgi:hypothetical protein
MNPDFLDLLRAFTAADVRFLIVGSESRISCPVSRMQRAAIALALVFGSLGSAAYAQTARADISGAVSFLPSDELDDFPRSHSVGFQIGATWWVNRWFGVFADVGGHYDTNSALGPNFPGVTAESTVYEYLFGPRFAFRGSRADGFVHGLFGVCEGHTNIGFSDTGLTFGGGGGVDIGIARNLAMRGQFDLFGSFADIVEANSRLSVGLVLQLGTR